MCYIFLQLPYHFKCPFRFKQRHVLLVAGPNRIKLVVLTLSPVNHTDTKQSWATVSSCIQWRVNSALL